MPEGEILYINSVGGFRKRKVKLDPTHPIVVKNHKDKQAHALDEKPVHSLLPPLRFESISALLESDAPKDPVIVSKWGIVCADNAVWPLSPQSLDQYLPMPRSGDSNDVDDEDTTQYRERGSLDDLRQLKYQEYCEEATQRAMHDAEKSDNKDGYLTTVSFVLGMVACTVLILIAAIIAYYKWGGTPDPTIVPPTASLLFMFPALGMIGLKDKALKVVKAVRVVKARKEPKEKPFKPSPGDAWVSAFVFDHPILGGKIWQAQMLYSQWMEVLPEACVFRPDVPRLRKVGALLGGAATAGMFFAIGMAILGLVGGAAGGITGAILGVVAGWLAGPTVLGNKPKIMVARIPDDNNTRKLVAIEHNYCRTVSVGDYLDNLESVLERLNSAGADEEDVYEPTVFRGTTFYDDLSAQDETAEVTSPNETLKKVQIGVMAAMAFGSVALLFFIALATSTPGA